MLPSPPEEVGTRFLFYSPRGSLLNVEGGEGEDHLSSGAPKILSYFNVSSGGGNVFLGGLLDDEGGTVGGHFNASLPTKVIIHGFGSTCLRMWANEMRNALLSVVSNELLSL
jgi:hypothetical protein